MTVIINFNEMIRVVYIKIKRLCYDDINSLELFFFFQINLFFNFQKKASREEI